MRVDYDYVLEEGTQCFGADDATALILLLMRRLSLRFFGNDEVVNLQHY